MTPYTPEFEEQVAAWIRKRVSGKRYTHIQGVVQTAERLARVWSPDAVAVCRLAGWIHDAAKHFDDTQMLDRAFLGGVSVRAAERENPMLLHGVVGYLEAAQEFGLDDPQLRSACTFHTTGSPDMNTVDKVVYLADMLEPGRDFAGIDELRQLVLQDLDAALLLAVDMTLRSLLERRKLIDPRVILLYNVLVK